MAVNFNDYVTKKNVETFQSEGVVFLRGVFIAWIEVLRKAIEQNKANPSWRERTYRPESGKESEFFQDYCVWSTFTGYRALVVDSPMASIAASLMCSKKARIFHDHVLVKEPGNNVSTPWHNDQPYYIVEGKQSVSFWVPLDPIPREQSIEFVLKSHMWDKDFIPKRFDGTDLYPFYNGIEVPDINSNRKEHEISGWEMKPGDAVAFNFRTLHSAPANKTKKRRRVTSIRWVGDDARFKKRPGKTSPDFPGLEYEDGDIFAGEEFPVLYPKIKN